MLFGLGLGLVVAVGVYLRPPSGTRSAEPPSKLAVAERPAARPASRAASEERKRWKALSVFAREAGRAKGRR